MSKEILDETASRKQITFDLNQKALATAQDEVDRRSQQAPDQQPTQQRRPEQS